MSRQRNFSPWAYWSLHREAVVEDDPLPDFAASDTAAFRAWRDRAASSLARLLGPMPESVPLDTEIRYPIAKAANSANAAEASRFIAFVLSPPSQAILARYGFGQP